MTKGNFPSKEKVGTLEKVYLIQHLLLLKLMKKSVGFNQISEKID
jgi:hypothetical protein